MLRTPAERAHFIVELKANALRMRQNAVSTRNVQDKAAFEQLAREMERHAEELERQR